MPFSSLAIPYRSPVRTVVPKSREHQKTFRGNLLRFNRRACATRVAAVDLEEVPGTNASTLSTQRACRAPIIHASTGLTGIPPGEFLVALRIGRVKQLLLTKDLSIAEICFEVGSGSLGAGLAGAGSSSALSRRDSSGSGVATADVPATDDELVENASPSIFRPRRGIPES